MNKINRIYHVSNFGEKCGIASYAKSLNFELSSFNNQIPIEEIYLNQQSIHGSDISYKIELKKITTFIKSLQKDGIENSILLLQWEPGIYGQKIYKIKRLLKLILKNFQKVQAVYIFMHTHSNVFSETFSYKIKKKFPFFTFSLNFINYYRSITENLIYKSLNKYGYSNINIIFFSKRVKDHFLNYSKLSNKYKFNLHDCRLQFYDKQISNFISKTKNEEKIKIATYGFISDLKGLSNFTRLLDLDERYELHYYGGFHPHNNSEFQQNQLKHFYNFLKFKNLNIQGSLIDLKIDKSIFLNKDLLKRFKFHGFMKDEDMLDVMQNSDVNIFMYKENYSTTSGPASIILQNGLSIICTNTTPFKNLYSYYKDQMIICDEDNIFEFNTKILEFINNKPKKIDLKNNYFNASKIIFDSN